MSDIDETLKERGAKYGEFADHARIAQELKLTMRKQMVWQSMLPMHKEALDMIAHKIARILNGDPNFHDSWHDIVGYAKLVADRLEVKP